MADITMCTTENCEFANTCYRKLAKADPQWQSWANFDCDDNKEYYYGV